MFSIIKFQCQYTKFDNKFLIHNYKNREIREVETMAEELI